MWKYHMKASLGYFNKKSRGAVVITHQLEANVYLQGNIVMMNFAKSKKIIIPTLGIYKQTMDLP